MIQMRLVHSLVILYIMWSLIKYNKYAIICIYRKQWFGYKNALSLEYVVGVWKMDNAIFVTSH